MKAIVCTKYGAPPDVLQLREVEKPVPGEHQVLIRVRAASVNVSDLAPVRGAFLARLFGTGIFKPKKERPGTDFAGQVEGVGSAVRQFKPGDEVFGAASGAYAEYVLAREDLLAMKSKNITFEEAAAVPVAGISALQGLQKGHIQTGQKVVVNGASGGVGTFAVQIAKSFGTEVTAVCSAGNMENARAMGADHVIDYRQEDFTRSGQAYDLILAVNGYHSASSYVKSLKEKGVCVVVGGSLAQIFQSLVFGPWMSRREGKKIGFMGIAQMNQKDLVFLGNLLDSGKIKPFIDRHYSLGEAVQAFQYLENGHARGKVILTMEN